MMRYLGYFIFVALVLPAVAKAEDTLPREFRALPVVELPAHFLSAANLGLIVNDDDPDSVRTADYYARQRAIPRSNVVHVSFPAHEDDLDPSVFKALKPRLDAALGPGIRALALAWTRPFRVGCMSVTMAFAAGYDTAYCATGCATTRSSEYFTSDGRSSAVAIRPAMLLAGIDFAAIQKLIDRGVRSDNQWPDGTAYLLDTPDAARDVRARDFAHLKARLGQAYPVSIVKAEAIDHRDDVMFYFTGLASVPGIDTLHFRDGAMADHLTSLGGVLIGSSQMSSLAWLQAGATGSYGTVTEPCNFPAKFPIPGLAMAHYLTGDSLIEAYWKSVEMPGQGVFIGEPLARPFGGTRLWWAGEDLMVQTRSLPPGDYLLQEANWAGAGFSTRARLRIETFRASQLRIANANPSHVFRIVTADR